MPLDLFLDLPMLLGNPKAGVALFATSLIIFHETTGITNKPAALSFYRAKQRQLKSIY